MTEDRTKLHWPELAIALRAAREALGLSQVDLASQAGVSEGSVQNLESGKARTRIPPSLAKIEPQIGWAAGSGVAVLNGGAPTSERVATNPDDTVNGELPLRIVDELKSGGPLLDSTVIRLPGSGDARMTIVVRGEPDASPEEIQKALLAWRRAERRLQELDGNEPVDGE